MKLSHFAIVLVATSCTGCPAGAQTTAAKPAAPATKAPALPAPPRTDANCLLVSNIFAQQSTDATQKARAQNVLFYYFGRLDARGSDAQLKAFRSGTRRHEIMSVIARPLSDEDIDAVAAWFASVRVEASR